MNATRHQAGEVRHVNEQVRADRIRDLSHAGEIPETRIGAAAANDDARLFPLCQILEHVVVERFRVPPDLVADDTVQLAAEVQLVAVGQVAAMRQVQAEHRVAGVDQRHVSGGVGLRTGVRLHIGMFRTEDPLCAVAGNVFDYVDVLTATVVALSRVALGIFVGKHRASRFQHRARDEVLTRNHLQAVMLAASLQGNLRGDLRVCGCERRVQVDGHTAILSPQAGTHT